MNVLAWLKNALPAGTKSALRRIVYFPKDAIDRALGRRDALTPPKGLMFIGKHDFKAVGEEFFAHFVNLGGLKPEHRVLDIGCGLGRMAVPMTRYLTSGSYDGFDVVPAGIEWAATRITPRYPNFRFHLADVYNKFYNPKGRFHGSEFVFPFDDDAFDFVFLVSVFTHMLAADVAHYLDEIARVLKPGGTLFATFLLLNDESRELIRQGKSSQPLRVAIGEAVAVSAANPEAAIAYPEAFVRDELERRGLHVDEPIHYGGWCGRDRFTTYQDIVIAHKTSR